MGAQASPIIQLVINSYCNQAWLFAGLLLFKLSMTKLGPFYHGTEARFDFKKDFDFAKGVGAIYMFANKDIKAGAAFARYVGGPPDRAPSRGPK